MEKAIAEKLEKIVKSDQIKTNGRVVIKMNLEADVLDIRKQIKELFNCSYSQINCKFKML